MNPQLGLCYVAAALKSENHPVQGIDFSAKFDANTYLADIPDSEVYGIYCMSVQFKWVKEICRSIRSKHPHAKIFIGGPHATTMPEDCFKIGADHVIKGYGDFAINDTLAGGIGRLDHEPLIPDRSIFDHYQYHRTINGERAFHIVTLRGCPYDCRYCDKQSVGKKVQYVPIRVVLAEIDQLMARYNARSFVIYDDIFTLDKARLEELCHEFRQRNLQWRCWARADLVDEANLALMQRSGLTSITFGIESGDDLVLKRTSKGLTVQTNYNALLACKKVGVPVRCSLMFGNPGERRQSLQNTIDMIKSCQPDEWNLAVLKPIPGSDFWSFPEKHGLTFDKQRIIDSDYEILNRFEDNGVGNILASIDSCSDAELKKLLPWFIETLEQVCPRKKIQDTIQEIKTKAG